MLPKDNNRTSRLRVVGGEGDAAKVADDRAARKTILIVEDNDLNVD